MKTKLATGITFIIILLSLGYTNTIFIAKAQTVPQIFVDPQSTSIYVGQAFTVNITVANATDLHGIDIKLTYDTIILDAVELIMMPPWPANFTGIFDSLGYVRINSTLTTPAGINGTTTIAQVTFKGIGEGTSTLSVADTNMVDSQGGIITFTHKDGTAVVTLFMLRVPYDYPTIQGAIDAANQSQTVFVYQGTYYERINIYKSITVLAQNNAAIIDGSTTGTVVNITSPNIILKGFTITNGTIGLNVASSGNWIQMVTLISH